MSNAFISALDYGSGGGVQNGINITVQTQSLFAGLNVTCTNAGTTLLATFPNSSPYEVTFAIPHSGTWTISCELDGETFTDSLTVPATFSFYQYNGRTILPLDSIENWLLCGNVFDKSYTQLSQVLADSITLQKLINSNNACDYMVRNTSWASDICSGELPMQYIGTNDYCAKILLADSTWRDAICNSNYMQEVLNVCVPQMTSDTSPSGVASASSAASGYEAYRAFDRNTSTECSPTRGDITSGWIRYEFTEPVCVNAFDLRRGSLGGGIGKFKLQVLSEDGSTWQDLYSGINPNSQTTVKYNNANVVYSTTYQIYIIDTHSTHFNVAEIQFYGRAQSA